MSDTVDSAAERALFAASSFAENARMLTAYRTAEATRIVAAIHAHDFWGPWLAQRGPAALLVPTVQKQLEKGLELIEDKHIWQYVYYAWTKLETGERSRCS